MDHSFVMAKGLAQLNEAMGHAVQGPPRWTGHSEEFWQNMVTGEGNGNLMQYSCLGNTLDSKKGQEDITPEDEPPRSEGVQYATGEEWRAITNSTRKNEVTRPKQRLHSVVDVSGGQSLML